MEPMTCPGLAVYREAYDRHANYPDHFRHHHQALRQIRTAMEIHRHTCPICRVDYTRSNYNARTPAKQYTERRPK